MHYAFFIKNAIPIIQLIGKLIVFGIIAAAVIVIAPHLLKGATPASTVETIKQGVEDAKRLQQNGTGSVGFGGILAAHGINSTGSRPADIPSPAAGIQGTDPPASDVTNRTYTGQVFADTNGTCQVSVPGMAEAINGQQEITHVIEVPNCSLPVNNPVQVTVTTVQNSTQSPGPQNSIQVNPYRNYNNDGNANTPSSSPTSQTATDPPAPQYFQTVQLDAVNQGTSAVLTYDDTTGQTTEVTVTMKNSEKVLFSGTFYSSQFNTNVNDVPNTPHIIEMTIQNKIYGTLHASVYAPPTIQNSTISGIFTN